MNERRGDYQRVGQPHGGPVRRPQQSRASRDPAVGRFNARREGVNAFVNHGDRPRTATARRHETLGVCGSRKHQDISQLLQDAKGLDRSGVVSVRGVEERTVTINFAPPAEPSPPSEADPAADSADA